MVVPTALSFGGVSLLAVLTMTGALLLLGLLWPGDGSRQIDWRPTRSPEQEAIDEIDDVQQMLNATNARRRRRGAPDLDEDAIGLQLAAEREALRAWAERRAGAGHDGEDGA
ncbi:MAG: hypothetical protein M0P31_12840 [Solirubrobacteraceae bacterium]|nr:hypothetical protein [Solirubrobacteraceae bacterium]